MRFEHKGASTHGDKQHEKAYILYPPVEKKTQRGWNGEIIFVF